MSRTLSKPTTSKNLILTERDRAIIRAAYRYRFITTDQVQMLTGSSSRSKLNDRLRELWGANYLDRPEYQREMFGYADTRPTVHALGQAGARWLSETYGVRFPETIDWRAKNRELKHGEFIRHTLGVTETMLQVERDVHLVEGLRVIDRDEVWTTSPRFNERVKRPFYLPTSFTWKDGTTVKRATTPDYIFGIADSRGERPARGLHFLEYDRGTENFAKSSGYQSSILQKMLGYADTYTRKLHEELYGYKMFRVLFVLEGDERRIANMRAVYAAHVSTRIPAGALLFTTSARLRAEGFLAPVWENAKGDVLPLLASTTRP